MKKFFIVIIVVLSLTGCPGPYENEKPIKLTFEEAVQEVYEMTGRTLFYSSDGKTMDKNVLNRITGPNEIPGVCTDYSIEFAYYWNEVKNYDEVYGTAYIAWIPSNWPTFYILDVSFVSDGTSKLRVNSSDFSINIDLREMDGVYRDTIVKSIKYNGKNILHFGNYQNKHVWIVIKIGDDYYDTDPTAFDIWGESRWNYYAPIKINF